MADNMIKTPSIAIGTWAWGDSGQPGDGYFGSQLTSESLQTVVDKAIENGFTLWDTAAVYGMGRSEEVLGEALKKHDRSTYQLSTKFTPQIADSSDNPVETMLDASLKRLNTDYIDLYWIHNPADVEKWTPYLIPLLKSGKIKHVGVSNHNIEQIKLADRILGEAGYRVEAVQNHFSLLYRSSEQAGVLDYCQEHNIQFFAYMVLEQGALTGRYNVDNPLPAGSDRANIYNGLLPQLQALTDQMQAMGAKRGVSTADIATAWAIAKGTTPIIGITKPKYIDDEILVNKIKLTAEEISLLESLADNANVDTRGGWEQPMDA
ncbi:aldo/keto reductase [Lactobacillus curvatus]|nr:aldo/keto reductase [Latilactobacillus curvatus]MSE24301.1 aldo/keto reductase [Latilactobacillus curvatus]